MKTFRSLTRTLAVVASAALLAGCAQLPTESNAQIGPSIQGGLSSDYLYYSPPGPIDGQSESEVLDGFLTAGTAPQNDYSTARDFLSQEFKAKWNPSGAVYIQSGKGQLLLQANGQAKYSVFVQAKVSADGTYSTVNPPQNSQLDFTLTKQNGQWRISSAPDVTVVNRPVFDVIFRSYSVYFYDREMKYLVPDLRWFPSRASTGTRLVNALLDGPSHWLAPAVQSAVPAGTKLAIDSVTTDGGIAVVDLSSKALGATPLRRQYMKEQLRATLLQLSAVNSVNLYIDHSLQDIPSFTVQQPPSASYTPVALIADDLVHVAAAGYKSISGAKRLVQMLNPSDFALASDDQRVALLTGSGIYTANLDQVSSSPRLIDGRPNLLAPLIDAQGYTWSMGSDAASQIYAIDENGIRNWVVPSAYGLKARKAFSISPEGSRIAIVTASKNKTRVSVASIIRDRLGKPISIGPELAIAQELVNPKSISWADENTLVGLAAPTAKSVVAFRAVVGGQSSTLASAADGVSIVGSNSAGSIHLLDSFGALYQYQVYDWKAVTTGVRAIHFGR
jgi:hypothetical protein